MTTHEPRAWDMYRTHDRDWYIITRIVHSQVGRDYVDYIDSSGGSSETPLDRLWPERPDEFLGNVLALPKLIEIMEQSMRDLHYLANGGEPSVKWSSMEDALCTICGDIEDGLREAGGESEVKP